MKNRNFAIAVLLLLLLSVDVNAQSVAYRIFVRSVLPTTCSKTASSIDIVVLSGTNVAYICVNPAGVYPANWGSLNFSGGAFTTPLLGPDGSAAAPTYSFSNSPGTGMWQSGNSVLLAAAGISYLRVGHAQDVRLDVNTPLSWASSGISAPDLFLYRDAANILAQRNGTNPQTFRIYNSFTDASNYERGQMAWSSNTLNLGTEAGGTGTYRGLRLTGNTIRFYTGSTYGASLDRWQISAGGHLLAETDNAYDIGASGATRPRTGYFGTSVFSPAATINDITFGSNGRIFSSTGQRLFLANSGASDAALVVIGAGATSAYPALKRNAASLDVRLADDSNYASLNAAGGFFTGAVYLANNHFYTTSNRVSTVSGGQFTFTSSATAADGTQDAGIARSAVAKIKITDGGAGYGSLDTLGIQFSGGSTLNNYTEGTWTPVLAFGGTSTGITYSAQVGRYTRTGNVVTFTAIIILTNKGSSVGGATITLPVTASNTANQFVSLTGRPSTITMTGTIQPTIFPTAPTVITLEVENNGNVSTLTDTGFANTSSLIVSGSYHVN